MSDRKSNLLRGAFSNPKSVCRLSIFVLFAACFIWRVRVSAIRFDSFFVSEIFGAYWINFIGKHSRRELFRLFIRRSVINVVVIFFRFFCILRRFVSVFVSVRGRAGVCLSLFIIYCFGVVSFYLFDFFSRFRKTRILPVISSVLFPFFPYSIRPGCFIFGDVSLVTRYFRDFRPRWYG